MIGAVPTATTSGMNADRYTRYTFDTNVLLHSLDARAPQKHRQALFLIGHADQGRCIVPLQTLGELCNVAAKKRGDLLPRAQEFVEDLRELFHTVSASSDDILEALTALQQHGLQFWDALLWATARRAGCTLLLSEDLQDGRVLEGVLFRNPFHLSQSEITSLLT